MSIYYKMFRNKTQEQQCHSTELPKCEFEQLNCQVEIAEDYELSTRTLIIRPFCTVSIARFMSPTCKRTIFQFVESNGNYIFGLNTCV